MTTDNDNETTVDSDEKAAEVRARTALGQDPAFAAAEVEMKHKSSDQRLAAYNEGRLSMTQLAWWSRNHPDEVPKISGEFAWIVMTTPEDCEGRQ